MRTIISHFYNESYLLPWWLKHHLELFDHGILIDYASTDDSADIIRTLAPHWQLVQSRNSEFDAVMCDFEVMQYEMQCEGWKMVLNTTEFLCVHDAMTLKQIEDELVERELNGAWFMGALMGDAEPEQIPDPNLPLVEQKRHGVLDIDVPSSEHQCFFARQRLYHRRPMGEYLSARQATYMDKIGFIDKEIGLSRWFGFSPWQEAFKQRKLQIKTLMTKRDLEGRGTEYHNAQLDDLESRRSYLLPFCTELPPPQPLTNCYSAVRTEPEANRAQKDNVKLLRGSALSNDKFLVVADKKVFEKEHLMEDLYKVLLMAFNPELLAEATDMEEPDLDELFQTLDGLGWIVRQ